MIFWLRFALRSVLRRRRRTLITFVSVGIGVAMLIVLGAIMVGVNDTMVKNAVTLQTGHLSIDAPGMPFTEALRLSAKWEEAAGKTPVRAMLPRLNFPAMLRHGDRLQTLQAQLVEPAREAQWSPIPGTLRSGTWLDEKPGIVIGAPLAKALAASVGDALELMTAERVYRLPVLGIFQTGVPALDQSIGYLSTATAKDLQLSAFVQLRLALFAPNGADLDFLRRSLETSGIKPGTVHTWREKLPEVEQLVKLNEFSMRIMIVLVIVILAFGVANSLLIGVMDRYRYYGILKAIGVRPRELVITVLGEAMIICLGAGALGTLLGVAIALAWGEIGLDLGRYTSYNPLFSINSVIYPRLAPRMVFLPQGLALLGGVLASLWPALVASRRRASSSMRDL